MNWKFYRCVEAIFQPCISFLMHLSNAPGATAHPLKSALLVLWLYGQTDWGWIFPSYVTIAVSFFLCLFYILDLACSIHLLSFGFSPSSERTCPFVISSSPTLLGWLGSFHNLPQSHVLLLFGITPDKDVINVHFCTILSLCDGKVPLHPPSCITSLLVCLWTGRVFFLEDALLVLCFLPAWWCVLLRGSPVPERHLHF